MRLDHLIQTWLCERQSLIITFNQLCEHRPFPQSDSQQVFDATQIFCQQLMDYVSFGHFRLFEKVAAVIESTSKDQIAPLRKLLSSLLQTTQDAVAFNDKQQTSQGVDCLERELSLLAESIALRLEWEDALIRAYLQAKVHHPLALTA